MTTYVAIPNGDIDQDSPITQPLMTAMRDNPIAMFEGSSGAPNLLYEALGALVAGSTVQSTLPISTAPATTTVIASEIGFMQEGTIRVSFGQRSGGQVNTALVKRWRNGTSTTLATYTTSSATLVSRSIDVTIQSGDTVTASHTGGSTSNSVLENVAFSTNAAKVWPFATYTSVV